MNYWIVAFLCISTLSLGIWSLVESELMDATRKKYFIQLAGIMIFEIVLDTIAFCIDGQKGTSVEYYKVIKIVEFIVSPLIPMMFSKIFARKYFWTKIEKWFKVLFVVNVIAQTSSFFVPLMFRISAQAVYIRTLPGYSYLMNLAICMTLLILAARHSLIQNIVNSTCVLVGSLIFVAISVVIRIFLEKCNSDWLSITMGYFIFLLYFNNNFLKIDTKTGLLNQNAFSNRLDMMRNRYSSIIVFIDANNLKLVNDTEGHGKGDWLLARIAEAVLKVYGKDGYCYRYGGDEFVVIFKQHVLRNILDDIVYHDKKAMLENLMKELDEELKKRSEAETVNENKIALSYGVSQGFYIYYTMEDKPSNIPYLTPEEVVSKADAEMYERKRKWKEANPEILARKVEQTANET